MHRRTNNRFGIAFRAVVLLLTAAVLTGALASVVPAARTETYLRGDLNGDGRLSANDYVLLKRHVLRTYSLTDPADFLADVNDDGKIDSRDYALLKRVIMKTKTFDDDYKSREIQEGPYETAVSVGCPYTVSISPASNYPDVRGEELTNGFKCLPSNTSYTDSRLAGFPSSSQTIRIEVDLKRAVPGIYRLEVSYLSTKVAAIGPLSHAEAEYSVNGTDWTPAGSLSIPAYEERMQTASLTLPEPVNARYVRFLVTGSAHWVFLDEVTVIADVAPEDADEELLARVERAYAADRGTASAGSGASPDRSLERVSLSGNASYVLSREPLSAYPDPDRTKMTDRVYGLDYEGEEWVGFSGKNDLAVTIDLGSVRNDIAGFSLRSCAYAPGDARHPAVVRFSVSKDKKTWAEAGRSYAPLVRADTYTYALEPEKTLSGRYVRCTVPADGAEKHLLDEFCVYAYGAKPVSLNNPYPGIVLPEVTKDLLWEGTEAELAATRNLLSGLPVQIEVPGAVGCSATESNTPSGSYVLTDGVLSPTYNIHSDYYVKFSGDAVRNLVFDLQKLSSVQSVELSFVYYPDWAINLPNKAVFYLSSDGVTWYRAGDASPVPDSTKWHITAKLQLDSPVAARFLSIRMDIPAWVGLDEIRAFGTRGIRPETLTPAEAGLSVFNAETGLDETPGWAAPSPDLLEGAKDIFLAYHEKNTVRTEADLLYQIGYYDENGVLTDTMFDGILFLMAGQFPSGLGGGTGSTLYYNRSDAEWLLDVTFGKGKNLDALESAAGTLKTALGLPEDYRVRYYLSLYKPACDDFGDVDGDGKNEDLTTVAGKQKVLRWIIDETEKRIANRTDKNILFGGYYWYDESMASDRSDIPLVNDTADAAHAYGRQLFWIPYYTAYGWSNWQDYGLDSACLQPNYAFTLTIPDTRLNQAASMADEHGMSIEIEMDTRSMDDARYLDRYFAYLEHGSRLGFMENAVHLYYMGGGSLSRFANGDTPLQRLLYDNTYHFIKRDLQTSPETPKDRTARTQKNTFVSGSVAGNADSTYRFRLYESPKHGTVALTEDGHYTYYPDRGYTGKDSFSFVCSRHMADSAPASVTVTVAG